MKMTEKLKILFLLGACAISFAAGLVMLFSSKNQTSWEPPLINLEEEAEPGEEISQPTPFDQESPKPLDSEEATTSGEFEPAM